MTIGKKPDAARLDKIVADARRAADQHELGYRERSLNTATITNTRVILRPTGDLV
ncbi:MAG: hypothetical protein V4724_33475 [Pseudomonadota bacterium]